MLTVPRYRTKWGSRAFAVAAHSTSNSLPVNLRTASTVTSFKKMLKIFPFQYGSPPLIPRRFGAQLTTYALTLDIELVSIWILRLWSRISEDLGAIEVTELNWIKLIILIIRYVLYYMHSLTVLLAMWLWCGFVYAVVSWGVRPAFWYLTWPWLTGSCAATCSWWPGRTYFFGTSTSCMTSGGDTGDNHNIINGYLYIYN